MYFILYFMQVEFRVVFVYEEAFVNATVKRYALNCEVKLSAS
jgi:hypothetical protein